MACNKRQSCLSFLEHTCGRLRYSRQDCLYYIKIIARDLQDKGGKTYACSMGNGIIFYDNHSYTGDGWYLLTEHTIPVRLEMRDGKIHRVTTGQQIEIEQITGRVIAIGIPIPHHHRISRNKTGKRIKKAPQLARPFALLRVESQIQQVAAHRLASLPGKLLDPLQLLRLAGDRKTDTLEAGGLASGILPGTSTHHTTPNRIAATSTRPSTNPSRTALATNNKTTFILLDISPPRGYIVSNNGWQDFHSRQPCSRLANHLGDDCNQDLNKPCYQQLKCF